MQWLFKARHWLAFGLILVACFLALQKFANYSLVRINLKTSHTTFFKVYWTTQDDEVWSEDNAAAVRLSKRKHHYILPIPVPLSEIKRLRVNPSGLKDVSTTVKEISLYHLYTKSINFGGPFNDDFKGFNPIEQVGKARIGSTLRYTALGNTPGFEVDLPQFETLPQPWLLGGQAVLITLLLYAVLMRSSMLFVEQLRWVPMGMLLAFTAILAMALISKYNSHPDEFAHVANARYFVDHYAPPVTCSEEARDTYTIYGVSRLDKREIAYFIGGRVLQLADPVPAREYVKLRLINVSLFLVLVLLVFREPKARIIFLPLLLTPQAWYLFSYYNSDALSLFIVMITAYQIFVPKSMLRRLLIGERPPAYIVWVLVLCLVFAMQYWLKLNYVFYTIFLAMLGGAWWLLKRRRPDMRYVLPVVIAFVLGTSIFLSWEISRHAINDFALKEKVIDCREQLAGRMYRPSTPLEETERNYRLRDKGYSAMDVIFKFDWPERIFYTGLGTYGYTEILNSYPHFEVVSVFIILLFLYSIVTITIRGDAMARLAVICTMGAICSVTLAAFWANWSMDFQPQGRYLMVYLAMFGSLLAMYGNKLNMNILSLLASVPFLLAAYSFLVVALLEIPK